MSLSRIVLLASLFAALAGCGGNDRAYLYVRETSHLEGEHPRAELSGCTDASGVARGGAFAVGAEVDVVYGERAECLDYDWWSGCREYAPEPTSVELTSTRPDVLAENDHGTWTFLAPGETTLVLVVDGVEALRQPLRAERIDSLDAVLVAQPAVFDDYDRAPILAAELASIDDLVILRGGAGARVVVRPRAADGSILCGRPPLAAVATSGLGLASDAAYWTGPPRAHEVLSLTASADAERGGAIDVTVGGVVLPIAVETVAPSELTDLVVVDRPTGRSGDFVHIVELTTWAADREVFGASVEVRTNDAFDCTGTYAYGPEADLVVGDTRIHVAGFCGNDSSPSYGVSVIEAPTLSHELVLTPHAPE